MNRTYQVGTPNYTPASEQADEVERLKNDVVLFRESARLNAELALEYLRRYKLWRCAFFVLLAWIVTAAFWVWVVTR